MGEPTEERGNYYSHCEVKQEGDFINIKCRKKQKAVKIMPEGASNEEEH